MCNGGYFDFSLKLEKKDKSLKYCEISYKGRATFMSWYGLYLCNPSTDLILLLHMERTYIGAVQQGLLLFLKIEELQKLKSCDILPQDFYVYMVCTVPMAHGLYTIQLW